jgi:hypothetical protein
MIGETASPYRMGAALASGLDRPASCDPAEATKHQWQIAGRKSPFTARQP